MLQRNQGINHLMNNSLVFLFLTKINKRWSQYRRKIKNLQRLKLMLVDKKRSIHKEQAADFRRKMINALNLSSSFLVSFCGYVTWHERRMGTNVVDVLGFLIISLLFCIYVGDALSKTQRIKQWYIATLCIPV